MPSSVCDGLLVLEMGVGRAGAVAGMFLADNGARVLKLEPPEGDRLREQFRSAFLVWNRGKESLVVDLRTAAGRREVQSLVAAADVVIEAFGKETAEQFGIDGPALLALNPRLIHCSIKGFPASSAYGNITGYDGIIASKAGQFLGSAQRDGPKFSNFWEPSYGAAHLAVQGILAALIVRDQTGRGQLVESTLYQGLFPYDLEHMIGWHLRQARPRPAPEISPEPVRESIMSERLCTKDGRWVEFMSILPHQFRAYIRVLGLDHMWEDPAFKDAPLLDAAVKDRFRDQLFARFRERTLEEWRPILATEKDLVWEPLATTEEAMQHPQAVYNRASIEVDDPTVGPMHQAAFPAVLSETPASAGRPAPRLGEHGELPVVSDADRPANPVTLAHPLQGLTLVEVANFYAAPFALTLLASLGARVIKIEALTGDPWRDMFNGIAGVQTLEGKESIALDLRTPEGQSVLHRLVGHADALLFGFRPGTEHVMRADYETLKAINPRLIYMNAPGYGSGGPYALRPMYGNTTKAMMGGSYRQAGRWFERQPAIDSDIDGLKTLGERWGPAGAAGGDPESASARASILLLALLHQQRTGRGQFIEAPMVNLNAFANAEDFNTYAGKQPMPLPDKGEHGLDALYRLYRAAGSGWVFLAAPTQAEWQRFTDALAPELAADDRFASRSSRQQHDAELADAVGRLLAARTGPEWEAICVPLGIGCVAFHEGTIGSFSCTDPVIREAGLVAEVSDPRFGRYLRHGAPVTLSETPAKLVGGPAVGEHTAAILAELGYSDEEISALAEARIIGVPGRAAQPFPSGAGSNQLDGQIRT